MNRVVVQRKLRGKRNGADLGEPRGPVSKRKQFQTGVEDTTEPSSPAF